MKLTFKEKQKTLFQRAKKLRENATDAEKAFEKKLLALNVKFIFQKGFINDDYYCIVDFYLPRPHKLCIEIDGGYHLTPAQQKKDKAKDRYLKNVRGFKVLRLTNKEAERITSNEIHKLIF